MSQFPAQFPAQNPQYGPAFQQPGAFPAFHQPSAFPQPVGQFFNTAITQQPQGAPTWMPIPQGIPNCPPGLEYLTMIDQILIKQQLEFFEIMANYESENKYRIQNTLGQDIYFASEESDCCSRNCLRASRPFEMKIIDNLGREVIHLSRPYSYCNQQLEVSIPIGEVIGSVVQNWSLSPSFSIQNSAQETIFSVTGPCCSGCTCGDVNFNVMSSDGVTKVGKIRKQWSGFAQESFSNADNFGITFPMELDVRMKAVMLGTCFLIDFVYFESTNQNQNQNRHH